MLRKTIALLILVGSCFAQTTHTFPALDTNNTFTGNNTVLKFIYGEYLAAAKPTPVSSMTIMVTDGATAIDCTTGLGSSRVMCQWNGSAWVAVNGGAAPGSNRNVIFNNNGVFAGSNNFTFNSSTGELALAGSGSGCIEFLGSTSGSSTICAAAVAGSPNQINLPTTTGTSGQALTTNGGSPQQLSWASISATPASPANSVQFNDGGAFGGDSGLTWNAGLRVSFDGADAVSPTGLYSNVAVGGSTAGREAIALKVDAGNDSTANATTTTGIRFSGGYNNAGSGGTVTSNYGADFTSYAGVGTSLNAAIHIADQGTGATDYAIRVDGGKTRLDGPIDLAGSQGTSGQVLTSGGTNVAASWTTPANSGILKKQITITAAQILAKSVVTVLAAQGSGNFTQILFATIKNAPHSALGGFLVDGTTSPYLAYDDTVVISDDVFVADVVANLLIDNTTADPIASHFGQMNPNAHLVESDTVEPNSLQSGLKSIATQQQGSEANKPITFSITGTVSTDGTHTGTGDMILTIYYVVT